MRKKQPQNDGLQAITMPSVKEYLTAVQRDGKTVYNYDRELDIAPTDKDTEIALAVLVKEYN